MGDPRAEMMELAERSIARQNRIRAAIRNGTLREFIRSEAKAARERYAEFVTDRNSDAGEAGE